ncbi:transglutaminase superfamily protein [Orenia metallireducens]|uniref:Transglutaminase-like superfamily protein n=1 Tax=Orenia metallireducens TaxID=1413210 RepID=A0A285IG11_9FIRM|nr:DUF3857 domain-containing protein [Orenia metallireducens]PRX18130.1 transglutaminase superfamily protein [Orenia metallireducens]SNY46882.1 Transglutaminase-like superfamily protein [Orenia metallireducens]
MRIKRLTITYCLLIIAFVLTTNQVSASNTDITKLLATAPSQQDYPQAGAVILKNETIADYTGDQGKIHERIIIKVFNKRGIDKFGEFKIWFDKSIEDIEVLEAKTIKKDGTVIKPKEDAINEITDPEAAQASIYSDARIKVISMSGVEPGSIIVLDYIDTIKKSDIKGEFWYQEMFQSIEPIKEKRFVLKVPIDKKINYRGRFTDLKPTITENKGVTEYVWADKDIAAIIKESWMPPLMDVAPIIKFSTLDSWSQVSKWYQGLIDNQYDVNDELRDKIKELIKGANSEEEKIKALYNYVTSQIRYVGLQFGESGYKPYPAVETFENKYGVCKEKATLLIAMLREIGVEAEPVVINRSYNPDLEIVSPSQFNHMIVYLPKKNQYLDPTNNGTMYGVLPGDQNKNVFLLESDKLAKTPISKAVENKIIREQNVKLNEDGSAVIDYVRKSSGVDDFGFKSFFNEYNEEQRKLILKQMISPLFHQIKLNNIKFEGIEDLDKNAKIELDSMQVSNYAKKMGNLFTIQPLRSTIDLSEIMEPDKRIYPIDLGNTRNDSRSVEIKIPQGYKVNYLPENIKMKNNVGELRLDYTKEKDKVIVNFDLKINKIKVEVKDYQQLRELLNKAASSIENQILIEKI